MKVANYTHHPSIDGLAEEQLNTAVSKEAFTELGVSCQHALEELFIFQLQDSANIVRVFNRAFAQVVKKDITLKSVYDLNNSFAILLAQADKQTIGVASDARSHTDDRSIDIPLRQSACSRVEALIRNFVWSRLE